MKLFGYFHELLDHTGKGNGIWLGCSNKDVVEQSYIEGEVGKEIVPLYSATDSDLKWLPGPAQAGLVVKRWKNGAVWAGYCDGSAKTSSCDEWLPLPK